MKKRTTSRRKASVRGLKWLILAVLFGAIVFGVLRVFVWDRSIERSMASEEVVAGFFQSLAALDVEENERAARVLKQLVEKEPSEPALWANLAVAQMRLRDMENASQSLQQAITQSDNAGRLALIRAELLKQSGNVEQAIEQLRIVHREHPDDLASAYDLVALLGKIRTSEANVERLAVLTEIVSHAPDNLRAKCEQARLAATLQRPEALQDALSSLVSTSHDWPEGAKSQLEQAQQATRDNDFQSAARTLTFMENLLKPRPEYQHSLVALGLESTTAIGTPLRDLVRLTLPQAKFATADEALRFELGPAESVDPNVKWVVALEQAETRPTTFLSLTDHAVHIAEPASDLPFPGTTTEATVSCFSAVDLDFDFRQDLVLVGTEGARVYRRVDDGSFQAHPTGLPELTRSWRSIWSVDFDTDGDLDLFLSDHESPLTCIRNNGDMTFDTVPGVINAEKTRQLLAADFDLDGDADIVTLDASNLVAIWRNNRGGQFVPSHTLEEPCMAIAVADVDVDGRVDLITLSASGELHRIAQNSDQSWDRSLLAKSETQEASRFDASAFLDVADLDNNGAVDLIVSRRFETTVWLQSDEGQWIQPSETPPLHASSVADMNGDGRLDLIGMSENGSTVALNQSQAGYQWIDVRTLANTAAGDKRINPFGIGGRIEIRAGKLVQAAVIDSPRTHFGLGEHAMADVARIVWPNGTVQAEFELKAEQLFVSKQRLKGSCPWVFAHDGQQFHFVKDFIWRSPLGLRINAQATAGVAQTEDWIKIPGEALADRGGYYDVRITAELWETHFFDHVSLLAVDYPEDMEIFVDERFVPGAMQQHKIWTVKPPQRIENATDHQGRSLDKTLSQVDGHYADQFSLGDYQGVAEEHWVEFDLPESVDVAQDVLIVGNGWIYPTDSSLNVALSQSEGARPSGLVLEQRGAQGQWRVVNDNLGFPAGKNKDVVIKVPTESISVSRRFRLRTNMEVYWDWLGWTYAVPDAAPRVHELSTRTADLHYRGYSKMRPTDRRRPDTPIYEIATLEQCWLDLEGFYTRFGEVHELLAAIDDRYVIMNAGDELVFEFQSAPELPGGWRRDFILVGDGWVKDGDFNTAFSPWVRPLPSHEHQDYAGPLVPLERDPIYLKHRDDWRNYHTRYVTPQRFQRGLWPPTSEPPQTNDREGLR